MKADARKKVAALTGRGTVRSNGKSNGSPKRNGYKQTDRRAAARQSKRRAPSRIAGALLGSDAPEWSDLVDIGNQRLESAREPAFGAISTVRFVLAVLAVAGIFTLYVGHVYSTQELLANVQAERRENLALRLQLNRTKGLYDAATGPAAVYERAHGLGLEENAMSGPPIRVPDE